jgi:hypothetical protein
MGNGLCLNGSFVFITIKFKIKLTFLIIDHGPAGQFADTLPELYQTSQPGA